MANNKYRDSRYKLISIVSIISMSFLTSKYMYAAAAVRQLRLCERQRQR